jgi:hypothetical protein
MVRSALLLGLAIIATPVCAPAQASQTNPYAAASARMADASSMRLDMTFTVAIAGRSLSFIAHGVEFPKRHDAAMQIDMTKLDPALGVFEEVGFGHSIYIRVPAYQTLKRRAPKLKPWVSVRAPGPQVGPSTGAAAGFNGITDIVPIGPGVEAGEPVERYSGKLVLAHALAGDPALGGMLARVGSLRALFDAPLTVRFDVGKDGYLRGTEEAFTLPLANGLRLAFKVTLVMSGFNAPLRAIEPPARDQIMTYEQFQQQVGSAVSLPIVI